MSQYVAHISFNRRATESPLAPKKESVTMSNSTQSEFPELLQLKLPRGTDAALDELASRRHALGTSEDNRWTHNWNCTRDRR